MILLSASSRSTIFLLPLTFSDFILLFFSPIPASTLTFLFIDSPIKSFSFRFIWSFTVHSLSFLGLWRFVSFLSIFFNFPLMFFLELSTFPLCSSPTFWFVFLFYLFHYFFLISDWFILSIFYYLVFLFPFDCYPSVSNSLDHLAHLCQFFYL